jgi:hypothetical protein
MALAFIAALLSCKSDPEPVAVAVETPPAMVAKPTMPTTVAESCPQVCAHQTRCLGAPELSAQCAQTCLDQAKLPEQQKNLLTAHKRIIDECFSLPCSGFDACFRRVVGEETKRIAGEVGATAKLDITPRARKAFKELFCKVVKSSGNSLPNLADPNASPDIKSLQDWMAMLAQDPTTMQALVREAEAECANPGATTLRKSLGSSPPAGATKPPENYAFAFRSALELEAMLGKLQALNFGSDWHIRDKDAWGDYIFGRLSPAPYNAVAKIVPTDGQFILGVKLRAERAGGEKAYAAVLGAVKERILPALGANAVTQKSYIEFFD